VLRALGFTATQLRRSVLVQSLATMLVALVVGVPLGVVAGRVLWQAFAEQLGVAADPSSPLGTLLVTIVGGIGLAILAAQVPARLAARAAPAVGLRGE
jgi:ABC-type antimicrobial peptide transport system permease subunit